VGDLLAGSAMVMPRDDASPGGAVRAGNDALPLVRSLLLAAVSPWVFASS